jgi:carbonic anhydrase
LTEKLSIIKQIENILTYPNVKQRFETKKLHIHGWYYHIENGDIEYFDAQSAEFLPLKDIRKKRKV